MSGTLFSFPGNMLSFSALYHDEDGCVVVGVVVVVSVEEVGGVARNASNSLRSDSNRIASRDESVMCFFAAAALVPELPNDANGSESATAETLDGFPNAANGSVDGSAAGDAKEA